MTVDKKRSMKLVVHNIWILTKKSGTSLYHKKYGSVEVDESLFSGFLSSINTLAESEFDQKGIDSINMGNYKFLYEHFCGVIFTVAGDPSDSDTELKELLVKARKRFFEQFSEMPWENYLKELAKSGMVGHFKIFENILDEVVSEYQISKVEEADNKKNLLKFYKTLINKFYRKVLAFSEVVDEDFQSPLTKATKNVVKNNFAMKVVEITEEGISFDSVDLTEIKLKEFKPIMHEILDALINTGYNLMGNKPINKIIAQLHPDISAKLPEVQTLGICFPMLQLLLKSND